MRLVISIVLIALLSYGVLLFLPWWACMPAAFLTTWLLPAKPGRSFLAGALGVALCWWCIIFIRDLDNGHLLSRKMADLFKLPAYGWLLGLNTFIGFITGGLGGWSAAILKKYIKGQGARHKAAGFSL